MFTSMDTNPESVEKREKRLRSRRERERARRASETAKQREERLRKVEKTENEGQLLKIGRHDCSKEGTDWLLRLPRRERPGCS